MIYFVVFWFVCIINSFWRWYLWVFFLLYFYFLGIVDFFSSYEFFYMFGMLDVEFLSDSGFMEVFGFYYCSVSWWYYFIVMDGIG